MSQLTSEYMAVVAAVLAFQEKKWIPPDVKIPVFGKYDLWMYDAVLDNKLCLDCLEHEKQPRFLGSELRTKFPYMVVLDENTIGGPEPNGDGLVHPNCRCRLHRVTHWTSDDIKWFVAYIGD